MRHVNEMRQSAGRRPSHLSDGDLRVFGSGILGYSPGTALLAPPAEKIVPLRKVHSTASEVLSELAADTAEPERNRRLKSFCPLAWRELSKENLSETSEKLQPYMAVPSCPIPHPLEVHCWFTNQKRM